MRLYIADTFVDDRPILSDLRVEAGAWHTAMNRAAWQTKERCKKGRRIRKMTIRLVLAGEIRKNAG